MNKRMMLSNQIINEGLQLHLEFGENWLTDIDNRLSVKHPELSKTELRDIDKLCRKVAKEANDFVRTNPVKKEGKVTFIDSLDFKTYVLGRYNWVNKVNLNRLYSQSCYYAMK